MSDDIEDTSEFRARVLSEMDEEALRADCKRLLGVDRPEAVGDACAHCDPVHPDPTSRPWGVYVAPACDSDGQPEYLIVRPSNGAHVAESDATWLWELIRNA